MTKPYITQIDAKIEALQDQIDELVLAKRIIMSLQDERPKAGSGQARRELLERADDELVALLKGEHKPKAVRRGPHVQQMLISNILSLLEGIAEPVSSAIIIRELEAQGVTVPKKQRVWAALSVMKKKRLVHHNYETGKYMLMEKVYETNAQIG